MAAFNFPDPLIQQTVTNPITGSTYQWKEPPGKWVVISRSQTSTDIIYEGDTPPIPRGEYKLWYSTDTLELYFWYEDTNGTSAWIPTSKPITGLEAVIAEVDAAGVDIAQAKREILENYDDIQRLQTSVLDAADIYHGDTAPTDDKYDLWYQTDDLELLVKIEGQWFPCTPNSRVDNVPTLQEVLEAGPPVALKDIFLTNAEDDIIDLAPSEARIVIGTVGEGNAPKFELRHKENENDGLARFEIDEGGTRLDIEADGSIDNIHFQFEDTDKFILNKTGDAQFLGKVQGVAGTQNNEFVTYSQLLTVEEELEQIAPSIERGTWNFTLNYPPGVGEYCIIKEKISGEDAYQQCNLEYENCMLNAGDDADAQSQCLRELDECQMSLPGDEYVTTNKFEEAITLKFNSFDANGVQHFWAGIDNHVVDLFNLSDDSFGVYDITSHSSGTFQVDVMSSRGTASGQANLKIFQTEGQVDFNSYVRKAGDIMFGELLLRPETNTRSLLVQSGYQPDEEGNILEVQSRKQNIKALYVNNNQDVGVSPQWTPSEDYHVTPKKYVDNYRPGPANYYWTVNINTDNGPIKGKASLSGENFEDSKEIRISWESANGLVLGDIPHNQVIYDSNFPALVLTSWFWDYNRDLWRWKGTASVSKIESFVTSNGSYLKLTLWYPKGNTTFTPGDIQYYFTLGGFF